MPADAELSVAGIVLAAGASTRFGRNKLLLHINGESLARRAAKAALQGGLDPVVVVLGHEADRIGQELSGLPVRTIVNPDYERGMNTSLRAGVEAVPEEAAAVVVL
ncbi:MAG TPA: NTP transferase domain-containing protein, partial [Thermoanaerobaculia bacterium]|nr:NTP transferase domain-containing protein [Thermoanaerobaculia bacterium]